jgi:hypothetical protein
VEPLSYKYPIRLFISHALSSPQAVKILPCECFVCFGANSEGTLEASLQKDNAWLPTSLITSLCCSIIVLC